MNWPPGVNGALESTSGGVLGLGDGGHDSREDSDDESERGETSLLSSRYVV